MNENAKKKQKPYLSMIKRVCVCVCVGGGGVPDLHQNLMGSSLLTNKQTNRNRRKHNLLGGVNNTFVLKDTIFAQREHTFTYILELTTGNINKWMIEKYYYYVISLKQEWQ